MADWKSSQEFLKEFYASPIVNEDTISCLLYTSDAADE